MPKYPDIHIQLENKDGNAFAILGRVLNAMRRADIADQWHIFHREATAGNYDNLLATVVRWFDTDLFAERNTDANDDWTPYYADEA